MNNKQIKEALEVIKDSLEQNDHPVTGIYEHLLNYIEANIDDICDAMNDEWSSGDYDDEY